MDAAPPETRYVRGRDGVHIAYQVLGDGPRDLIFIPEWVNHVEAQWEQPLIGRFLRRLASFSRLILYDKRGTGLSDPVPFPEALSLDAWVDDVVAVLDAVGSERAAVFGHGGGGGSIAAVFAATHPDRTLALVLSNSQARVVRDADYPFGLPPEAAERSLAGFRESGLRSRVDLVAPTMAGSEAFRDWHARYHRTSTSPGTYAAIMEMFFSLDIRPVLPAVSAPTLVVHRRGDHYVQVGHGRYLAEHIRGAQLIELEGEDHLYFVGDGDGLADEVEDFLTGVRTGPAHDRALATILFTDITRSTEELTYRGDRSWSQLLDEHDAMASRQVERFRGRRVKATGDGLIAAFDSPTRAIHCASAIREGARRLGISVRAGMHCGEVELRGEDVAGITVHIAARVVSAAQPAEILVSRTVVDLVAGSGLSFAERGAHSLKGVSGTWHLFAVQGT